MNFPDGHWRPLVMPLHVAVPLRESVYSEFPEPFELPERLLAPLSVGCAPLWSRAWSWHWAADGVVHAFESGRESLRAHVRPLGGVPGARWHVTALEHGSRTRVEAARDLLDGFLDAVLQASAELASWPGSRAEAVAVSAVSSPAPPHPVPVLTDALRRRLPCPASTLHLDGFSVPLPPLLMLVPAVDDGAAALLRFSDGSRLWLHGARASLDPIGLTAVVGGALLWPGVDWPVPAPVAAWSLVHLAGRPVNLLRDVAGEALEVAAFPPAGDTGVANVVLDLPLRRADALP